MADGKRSRGTGSRSNGTTSTKSKTANTSRSRSGQTGRSRSGNRSKAKKKQTNVSYHNEILVLLLFALSVFLLLSNFNLCGRVGLAFTNLTFGVFGIIGYAVPFIIFGATIFFIGKNRKNISVLHIVGLLLLLALLCGISQLIYMSKHDTTDLSWEALHTVAMTGHAGGAVGGAIVKLVYPLFGKVGSYVILIALFLILLVLVTGISITEMIKLRSNNVSNRAMKSQKKRDQLREVKVHEREAMRKLREEQKQIEQERYIEQKKLDSERRIERARKEQEARMMLAGKRGEQISYDTSDASEKVRRTEPVINGVIPGSSLDHSTREMKIKNPVIDPADKPVSFLDRLMNFDKQTEAETGGEEAAKSEKKKPSFLDEMSFGFQEAEIEKEDNSWNEKIPKIETETETSYELSEETFDYDPAYDEPIPEDTDAPVYDDSKVISSKNKAAMIEKMKRAGANADGTKTIVTASGQIKTIEMDMGSEKHVAPMKREDGETTIFEDVSKAMQPIRPNAVSKKEYEFPPIDLLKKGSGSAKNMNDELRETAMKLQQTLQNFGVRVNVTNVSCGPAVTRYELTPEMGVKVSSIVRLQDDIKLNMAAADIRIEAPIPGKAAIGIEIPNKESSAVMLRDLLEGPDFKNHPSKLAFGAGKDIGGQTVISDVAKMPHLLIAGATGSGKSVCINTIIMSILYKAKPEEVKLIMIDPKVVELSVYNGIPHLMIPVVTDPKKAAGALSWAVAEMTSRYKKFAEYAVRDLKGYNEKLLEQYKGPEEFKPAKLPQLVIIVDELADLMMVAPGEVEDSICRLAQMARAAGIHLILATQRPSVNVITGLIKANVPSRIAFSVSSGVDSRTILDMVGAEKLLGKGDMLYYPAGMQKPIRVQGAFVSDKEVSAVVEFVTKQENVIGGEMSSVDEIEKAIESASGAAESSGSSGETQADDRNALDPLFKESGLLIVGKDKASIGMLQRAFRIGFNRAARIMEQLADAGLVGEEEGTKPRRVLMDETTFLAYCNDNNIS